MLEKRDKNQPIPVFTQANQPIFKDGRTLKDYQLLSLNWLIRAWKEKRNVILADEMGLGKTVQSMSFLNHLFSIERVPGPYLVLAPLSTLQHWKRVFEEWSNLNCVFFYDASGKPGRQRCSDLELFLWEVRLKGYLTQANRYCKAHVVLTSFEVFLQDFRLVFSTLPFQFIIVDEAHRLKNKNAKILAELKKLACDRLLLLTGTPIQNNIAELWSLLNYLEPKEFGDEQQFLARFGDVNHASKLNELKQVLEPYLLRRLKEEVETSIPPLQENIIDVELTQLQKVVYKTLYEKNKGTLQKGAGLAYLSIMNNLEMQLRKCCDHPFLFPEIRQKTFNESATLAKKIESIVCSSAKMIFVDKLLLRLKEKNQKILIFSQFTEMLHILEEYLTYRGWHYERIDGATRAMDRQTAIDRFNKSGAGFGIFLLSTKAGGLGINLTAANVVVIFDSDWNPQNDVQAIARAHRIGQTSEVAVFRLVSKKTYEAEMFAKASKKLGLDQAIFLGNTFSKEKDKNEENDFKKFKPEELDLLLKKGILGLLESAEEHATDKATYDAMDIDALIENASKTNYTLSAGGYTVSKMGFGGDPTSRVQIDDPEFWNKVFVEKQSPIIKMQAEMRQAKEQKKFKNLDFQKNFFSRFLEELRLYMEQRLKNEGYNADIENCILAILETLAEDHECVPALRAFGNDLKNDFLKSSRRLTKLDPKIIEAIIRKALESSNKDKNPKKELELNLKVAEKGFVQKEGGEKEKALLTKREKLPQTDGDMFNEAEDERKELYGQKPKKKKEEKNELLCSICAGPLPDFVCAGHCRDNYHKECLEQRKTQLKFEGPTVSPDGKKCFLCNAD